MKGKVKPWYSGFFIRGHCVEPSGWQTSHVDAIRAFGKEIFFTSLEGLQRLEGYLTWMRRLWESPGQVIWPVESIRGGASRMTTFFNSGNLQSAFSAMWRVLRPLVSAKKRCKLIGVEVKLEMSLQQRLRTRMSYCRSFQCSISLTWDENMHQEKRNVLW